VAIQQNSASTGTKAYVIAADTERMEIAVVQWREVEAHNLSNVDAKPLTLPCSVIAHLTKPRCETSTFPSSLSSEGYRMVQIHQLSLAKRAFPRYSESSLILSTQTGFAANYTSPRKVEHEIFDVCTKWHQAYRGELPGISV